MGDQIAYNAPCILLPTNVHVKVFMVLVMRNTLLLLLWSGDFKLLFANSSWIMGMGHSAVCRNSQD